MDVQRPQDGVVVGLARQAIRLQALVSIVPEPDEPITVHRSPAEIWLEGLGAPKVMLMIREENERVRRFYERLGYGVEKRIIMSRRMTEPPVAGPR